MIKNIKKKIIAMGVIAVLLLLTTVGSANPILNMRTFETVGRIEDEQQPPEEEGFYIENLTYPGTVAEDTPFVIEYDFKSTFIEPEDIQGALLRLGYYMPVVDVWYGWLEYGNTGHRTYTCNGISETTEWYVLLSFWNGEHYEESDREDFTIYV